jgi:murein DD-endopeptidase MepM/ murein hydrolase activator NlpD
VPQLLRILLRRNPTPVSILRSGRGSRRIRRDHLVVPGLVALIGAVLSAAVVAGVAGTVPAAAGSDVRHSTRIAAAAALPVLRPAGEHPDAVIRVAARRAAARPHAASRSMHRAPLHRWVRPYYGDFTSAFGYRWGRLHAGVDLAGPWGDPIVAATDGCITYAGPESGYGEVMRIADWDGTETVYGHMSSFVRTSGCVHAGDLIARVGAGGDATGPHLHFEVRVDGTPINPVPFLAKRGVFL